jgi:hypothetical protein
MSFENTPYQTTRDEDSYGPNNYISISRMLAYEHLSVEEIRWNDRLGVKSSRDLIQTTNEVKAVSTASPFGQSTTSGFGTHAAPTTLPFGQSTTGGFVFEFGKSSTGDSGTKVVSTTSPFGQSSPSKFVARTAPTPSPVRQSTPGTFGAMLASTAALFF